MQPPRVEQPDPSVPLAMPAAAWVWVAHPREDAPHEEGWWSCHRATRAGDLALVYRTAPIKAVTYLVRAESDAAPVREVQGVPANTGYACRYALLSQLPQPLLFGALAHDPVLSQWGAVKKRFVGAVHPVPADVWAHLLTRLAITPRTLGRLVARRSFEYRLECDIQEHLVAHHDAFRRVGRRLRLVKTQYYFRNGRIADLVYRTPTGRLVVVELKRGAINEKAVDQIRDYLEQMQKESQSLRRPVGILVGSDLSVRAAGRLAKQRRIRFVSLGALGLRPAAMR